MPIYDNLFLFISLIIAYVAAFVVLFIPANEPFMWSLFRDMDFCVVETAALESYKVSYVGGTCKPDYNYFLIILGVADTIITYFVEALFIRKFTVSYDNRKENQKMEKFAEDMKKLIPKDSERTDSYDFKNM